MIKEYQRLKENYLEDYKHLTKKYNVISTLRLLIAIALIFSAFKSFSTSEIEYLVSSVITLIAFLLLLIIHGKISWNRRIKKELIDINNDEISYLKGEDTPYADGSEYIDFKHFFSFDLDFFGKNSLFQNLNRTAIYIGSKKLSELLLSLLTNSQILSNQQAILELSKKIVWRQHLFSLSRITKDSQEEYQNLIKWSEFKQRNTPKILYIVLYTTPILFISSLIAFLLTKNPNFLYASIGSFLFNLALVVTQIKKIKREIINSDKIHDTVKKYGLIIEQIENEKFDSEKLNSLKQKLTYKSGLASKQIKRLSSLFSNLESIHNVLAAFIFNGTFLYHIFVLVNLLKWKEEYSKHIKEWLDVIGEFEALNSLSNFLYNNPTFSFPSLNKNYDIEFKELGHPLIDIKKRIRNNVAFKKQKFIILTGSNMSGKSTFLRTLGVNMVLAGIGAPICSTKANVHPLKVIVSMRQSDSLYEGESYFFAEVKRLKKIMNELEEEIGFVLLDEVLKGTNSEDKQTGTIKVIKKIISKNAIGSIATHDLDICQITDSYPNNLINKCFEAEIINNDLSFDYKLKNGICKNKSATFLMKKMKII